MADVKAIPLSDRQQLASLIDPQSAADAMAAYYALEHPEDKVRLFGYASSSGDPRGFLAVAQTGLDLFRPLVVPFVATREILVRLLRDALRPGQPILLHLPADQLHWLDGEVEIHDEHSLELLRLEPSAYEPILNVLVVETATPSGRPRYEINNAHGLRAAAGVNWWGSRYAEIYLAADDRARGSGLTRSVLSALVGRLLGQRIIGLYRVETNRISVKTEAFHLGFRPTGVKTALIEAVLLPEEERT
ncbi:MAG: hypothetical protein WBR18_15095 [Anaerolineales bacterium]